MGKKKNKKKTTPKGAATPVKPTPPVQVEAPAPAEVDVVAAPVAPEPPVKVEAPAAEDAVASTEDVEDLDSCAAAAADAHDADSCVAEVEEVSPKIELTIVQLAELR